MAELFRRDGGDKAVEGAKLVLAAEVEALEHVVPKSRHLSVFAAKKLLKGGSGIGILALGRRQIDLKLIDT
jgi:hypothetical protein